MHQKAVILSVLNLIQTDAWVLRLVARKEILLLGFLRPEVHCTPGCKNDHA